MCRRMQTNRKLKCPIDKRKSACNFIEPELTGFVMFADIFFVSLLMFEYVPIELSSTADAV